MKIEPRQEWKGAARREERFRGGRKGDEGTGGGGERRGGIPPIWFGRWEVARKVARKGGSGKKGEATEGERGRERGRVAGRGGGRQEERERQAGRQAGKEGGSEGGLEGGRR